MREGYTGRGTGTLILRDLESKALEIGISTILALVSSLNPGSLHFHLKNGFTESGRLIGIGEKKGRLFDVIYCQKSI
jgi:phosphinothricin acetyltransferase